MNFPVDMKSIWERVNKIDPIKYSSTRNYKNGAVSYLSPYISRGIISTKQIIEKLKVRGFTDFKYSKFEQELAWREFWQRVWLEKGDLIYNDLKHKQNPIQSFLAPLFLKNNNSGIETIDQEITNLKKEGYMHNHMRMYLSFLVCNAGQFHWKKSADWMYYHLLDGDVASNYLSWQWVAGANSNKKYIANQENINRFFDGKQKNTFLNTDYESIQNIVDGEGIEFETQNLTLTTPLPQSDDFDNQINTIKIYNYYNLDPEWRTNCDVKPILLLEPSVFKKHPVSLKNMDFILQFNEKNLKGKVFVGEFEELVKKLQPNQIYYKEHPLNKNYSGTKDEREWMFEDPQKYTSFFSFWKKVKKSKREEKQ